MGTCPNIKTNIAILIAAYEASRESQSEIVLALTRAARARIAQEQVYYYLCKQEESEAKSLNILILVGDFLKICKIENKVVYEDFTRN